jgi:cobaltochelatase CobN
MAAALALAPVHARAAAVSMIVLNPDSWTVHEAVDGTDFGDGVTVKAFCLADLVEDDGAAAFVSGSDAVIVDVTDPRHADWINERGILGKPGTTVYAVRESADDDRLRREGYVFDDAADVYYGYLTGQNVRNAVRRILSLRVSPGLGYGPPEEPSGLGIYHPDAPSAFPTAEGFLGWYRARPGYDEARPWLALTFFDEYLMQGQKPAVDALVRVLEDEGLNVMPAFGDNLPIFERLLLGPGRKGRVDAVAALSLKFYLANTEPFRKALGDLDVPVFNGVYLLDQTVGEWRDSPQGISTLEAIWNMANPETAGAVEHSVVMGKTEGRTGEGARVYRWEAMEPEARHMARRVMRHVELARKPASEKKVAILYYNYSRGRQSVGAAYLNVFRSIADIAARLNAEGYAVDFDPPLDEEEVKSLVLRGGRNIGSWAPGELETLVDEGAAVLWPISEYRELFDGLPEEFRENVLAQWGPPEEASVMAWDGNLVLPVILRGNLAVMPQGARAMEDDPVRLFHDPEIFPHHQYLAVYLWLERVWKADAVVHLGTNGTLEWMPGKQSGLELSDPPEVLMGTLPDIYPYNMDALAMGIQAKRRGRAVMVDHLIPPLARAGAYGEYETLARLAASYLSAAEMDAATAGDYLDQIRELASGLSLGKDLGAGSIDGPEDVRALSAYLLLMAEADVPYGLHTFGTSPSGEARGALLEAISRENPGLDPVGTGGRLDASGENELASLVKGLSGRYVTPGEGNDPARNPEALPSGRNFYGLSPGRFPTREAWRLGREAADRIISDHVAEHGEYPDKVAVILWSLETMRNEGVNESTALALVGVEPEWAPSGEVTGTRPVPGSVLGRPRIDVTVDCSGLYRDLFPDRILFLDNAIRQAALQDDVENFIARDDEANRRELVARGYAEEDAGRFARARIFSERPGNYGNRVPEALYASGAWDDPEDVSLAFREHTGYAFGAEIWGEPARDSLELNLAGSKIAWHSVSSHLFEILDTGDFNAYLGGLAMAIASLSGGTAPETLVVDQRSVGKASVTGLDTLIGYSARTRYLNPAWIGAMTADGYAGAQVMSNYADFLFGFQVTVPRDVDPGLWDQTYEVYVDDKYGTGIREFMERENPWAFQSLAARLLETVRRGYWAPSDEVRRRLAVEYAASVVGRGVACSGLVCGDPRLNAMALEIISVPGAAAPELAAEFKAAIERAARKSLESQLADSLGMIRDLADRRAELDSNPPSPAAPPQARTGPGAPAEASAETSGGERVRGLRMESVGDPREDAPRGSSGIEWMLALFVLAIIAIFFAGYRRMIRKAAGTGGGKAPGSGAGKG